VSILRQAEQYLSHRYLFSENEFVVNVIAGTQCSPLTRHYRGPHAVPRRRAGQQDTDRKFLRLTLLTAVASALSILAMAGCSSESRAPHPAPMLPSRPPYRPVASAPRVANPLTINKITTEPCVGLTHTQLAPYMGTIREQETKRDAKSLACDWYAVDGNRNSISLFIYPETSVTEMYGASLGFSYFDRAGPPVAGYPTVRKSQLGNGPREGDCITEVAVSDGSTIAIYAYTVNESDPNRPNMCSVSDTLVEHVVGNLRPDH
jgi:hypothetical protein